MSEIREPIKDSSIKKKNKIIEKGFELMCEKGYHNVSSVDIAKYANVSTGIIYQYFNDKRDIFIAGVKNYANDIMFPITLILEEEINTNNLELIINKMIDSFIEKHKMSKNAHEELMAASHTDKEIKEIFNNSELKMSEKIVSLLIDNGFEIPNLDEKIHIIIGIVDNYCHEVVYHKHQDLDYTIMKDEVVKIILNLLDIKR